MLCICPRSVHVQHDNVASYLLCAIVTRACKAACQVYCHSQRHSLCATSRNTAMPVRHEQCRGICPVAIPKQQIWDIVTLCLKVFDQHPQRCCKPCRNICKELAPSAQRLCESFGIPDHLIAAPIATNWVDYNKVDNQGEMYGSMFR